MIVVDIETTGVDPRYHSIASIGAVDFYDSKNEFYVECKPFDGARIEKEALEINGFTKDSLFDSKKLTEAEAVAKFLEWSSGVSDHTVAGQNPHFDISFIISAAERAHLNASIPKRMVDLHSVCVAHMVGRGITPPIAKHRSDLDSDKIMKYVGIPAEIHPHIAINGARIEAEALSRLLLGKVFYDSYRQFSIPWLNV